MYYCTNNDCPYGAIAYDQDEDRWSKNIPANYGLCLNCIDDMQKDVEMMEMARD